MYENTNRNGENINRTLYVWKFKLWISVHVQSGSIKIGKEEWDYRARHKFNSLNCSGEEAIFEAGGLAQNSPQLSTRRKRQKYFISGVEGMLLTHTVLCAALSTIYRTFILTIWWCRWRGNSPLVKATQSSSLSSPVLLTNGENAWYSNNRNYRYDKYVKNI